MDWTNNSRSATGKEWGMVDENARNPRTGLRRHALNIASTLLENPAGAPVSCRPKARTAAFSILRSKCAFYGDIAITSSSRRRAL
jgi:hypothetical protein